MRYAVIALSLLLSVGFVGSQLGYAQTISIKSDQLSLGAAVWLPIAINAAPDGIHRYVLGVAVDVPEIAHIEDVRFPEPLRDFASFQIAPDGNSVQISVRDENDVITSGAQQTLLAEVKLRGTFGGRTGVTLAIREIVNDRLNAFTVAVANGQLTVAAAPSAPTLVVGVDGVLVGDTVRVPIILTSTVGGVQSYRARVRLERRDVATFIGAEFPFFADQQDVSITPDGDEITVGARDGVNAVQAGAKGILLVWLVLRGDLPDSSLLRLLSNNITEDNNNSGPLPSKDGLLTVIRLENLPPEFFGPQPRPQEILGDRSPLIQITISDDKNEVLSETIQITLQDEVQTLQFGWRSPGASWDPTARLFTVNLKAMGVQLSGDVRVRIRARDRQGAEGRFEWRFTVPRGEMPPPPPPGETLEELLDVDRDNRLNDLEILRALDAWIKGTELAPGLKIDDLKMLALIDKWIKGTPLRPTASLIVQETLPVPF